MSPISDQGYNDGYNDWPTTRNLFGVSPIYNEYYWKGQHDALLDNQEDKVKE